ncbi:hypothetical protein BGX27_011288 [Mortierella sp. AM989]|nr:hypothetical protein BGX27_011288 [Mortierella sp. AM989]
MALPQISESVSNVEAKRDTVKIGYSLLQMGDKYRDSREFQRAAKSYSLAKMLSPSEAQERLSLLPQWSLSSGSGISTPQSFGKGYHRAITKEKVTKAIKRLSPKSSLMGPFFPEGIRPILPPLMSQDSLTSQGTACTFNEAKDINSIVTSYIGADAESKSILRNQINEIIKQFDGSFICLEAVQELVILAKIPDTAIFLHIITQMLKVLNEKPLLASIVLQGMAVAINSCPEEINMDDMQGTYLEILRPLKGHLETIRTEQNGYQLIPLLHALSALLNAMVCKNISALDRETIFNPLIKLFDSLKSHNDTTVAFLALYAKQALIHIRNSESLAMSVFRRARLAIAMVGYIANGVIGTDLSKFESAYNFFTAMCDISVQAEWYPGLAYVDCILELYNWPKFEAFVLQSKLKSDKYFLQGICLRLEQIAATQQNEIHDGAIGFLQTLAQSSAEIVQKTAQAALKRLEAIGSIVLDSKNATRDDLPPVWDPIWHMSSRNTLLKAVQLKELANTNIYEMPDRLNDINQSITSISADVKVVELRLAQTNSELNTVNTNIGNVMRNTPTLPSLNNIHEALESYYKSSLFIQRVSGDKLDLESCYINLAVVEAHGQREKDKQDLKTQASTFQRMRSHEKIEGTSLSSSIPLEDLFNERELRNGYNDVPKKILIHGRAGIGKTTLCKKLVQLSLNGLWKDRFDAVLWLPLRELKYYKSRNLEGLISEKYFSPCSNLKSMALARASYTQVESGRVLFILDGLDEFQTGGDSTLGDFLSLLFGQRHVVITSRPSGVDKSILPIIDLELETIGFSSQNVKDYLQKVVPEVAKSVEDFIRRTPVIQGLVNIPIQLDAICFGWDSHSTESNETTMTGLYQTMVRKLWRKDAIRFGKTSSGQVITEDTIQNLTPYMIDKLMDIEIEYLGYLAFKGLKDGHQILFDMKALDSAMQVLDENRQNKGADNLSFSLLRDLKQTSFLHSADADLNAIANNPQGSWHFLHLTFQEYFAATWLARHLQNKQPMLMTQKETSESVLMHKYNPRFEIVWWMVAGQLEGETLISFFDLLEGAPVDLIGGYHHHLLAACLKESRSQLSDKRIESLETQLVQWLKIEMTTNSIYHGSILGGMSYFPEELLIRSSDHSSASHKYFIKALGSRTSLTNAAIEILQEALKDGDYTVRASAACALEKQPTLPESALQALIGALKDGTDSAAYALKKHSTLPESALLVLIGAFQDKNEDVRRSAAKVLEKQPKFPESVLLAFICTLQDGDQYFMDSLTEALEKQSTLPESALLTLIGALKDGNQYVRDLAVKALGKQSTLPESALLVLIGAFQDNNEDVRGSAAKVLGNQSTLPESVLLALISAFQDKNEGVRGSASKVLGNQSILPESVLPALISALQDEDRSIRDTVAKALGGQLILPESALLALIGAIQGGSQYFRNSSAKALGMQSILPESALLTLISALKDGDKYVRYSAAGVLGKQLILPESALQALVGALQHSNMYVRDSSAEVLGKHSTLPESALLALVGALQDEHENVRYSAAKALGEQLILPESALLALICALQDEDQYVRRSAAKALEEQSTVPESALQALLSALKDENQYVRDSTVKALGKQLTLPESALHALISAFKDENQSVRD